MGTGVRFLFIRQSGKIVHALSLIHILRAACTPYAPALTASVRSVSDSIALEQRWQTLSSIERTFTPTFSLTKMCIRDRGVVIAAPLAPVLESPAFKPAFDYVVPALFKGIVTFAIFYLGVIALVYTS